MGEACDASTHHRRSLVDSLSRQAPGLPRVLRETGPECVLLDGTLAECDRAGDSRADFSYKHRRHGVNVQVRADLAGKRKGPVFLPCPGP